MKDKTLLKISFFCSLFGILIILLITETTTIKKVDIGELTNEDIDRLVAISGQVTRITDVETVLIINIKDKTGEMVAMVFKDKIPSLKQYQEVTIEGKVIEYKGKLEIQVEEIRRNLI
ncbi:hypothetical protein K8R33_00550 [archaeon]|nr:hypothetical protein [archaeon]